MFLTWNNCWEKLTPDRMNLRNLSLSCWLIWGFFFAYYFFPFWSTPYSQGAPCYSWPRVSQPWHWASMVAQMVKSLPVMQETQLWSLDWEDPLEKWMATHSSILAGRTPWTEEPDGLQSMGITNMTEWLTLSLSTLPLWMFGDGQFLVVEAVLGIERCLAASLDST